MGFWKEAYDTGALAGRRLDLKTQEVQFYILNFTVIYKLFIFWQLN